MNHNELRLLVSVADFATHQAELQSVFLKTFLKSLGSLSKQTELREMMDRLSPVERSELGKKLHSVMQEHNAHLEALEGPLLDLLARASTDREQLEASLAELRRSLESGTGGGDCPNNLP